MTLYTNKKDTLTKSACDSACLVDLAAAAFAARYLPQARSC